jgi:hypothetical protein
MQRWRIAERFAPPDWSIVDLWIARKLLSQGMLAEEVQDVLRLGSPHFPRRHTDPNGYLRRTLAHTRSFPAGAAQRPCESDPPHTPWATSPRINAVSIPCSARFGQRGF